jgi:hypothetical protein
MKCYTADWTEENNPVQVIDVFVDELDIAELGFGKVAAEAAGRPSYHPSVLLKLYIYGYLNRVPLRWSRRTGDGSTSSANAIDATAAGVRVHLHSRR